MLVSDALWLYDESIFESDDEEESKPENIVDKTKDLTLKLSTFGIISNPPPTNNIQKPEDNKPKPKKSFFNDEDDDDTPFMEEALSEKQEINLTDIFKKELVNESKYNIFITINTMRNLEDYDKEVLCKIFFCLLDNY